MRIGSVPFLNALPLIHGLKDVEMALPSALVVRLQDGTLDAALAPVVEALEHPGYSLVDGVCIGSKKEVRSVILVERNPGALARPRSIALDHQSKTSVALTRILAARWWKWEAEMLEDGADADLQLMIGDRALDYRARNPEAPILDLATEWHQWTGLPFVFAVWLVREEFSPKEPLAARLREAQKQGIAAIPQLAKNPDELDYLTHQINYELGDEDKKGLLRFQQEWIALHQQETICPLHWI